MHLGQGYSSVNGLPIVKAIRPLTTLNPSLKPEPNPIPNPNLTLTIAYSIPTDN
jgi:hypothetical protein